MFRLNCNNFEKTIFLLARNRLVEAATRELTLRHAETCDRCATRLVEERALVSAVREALADIKNQQAPPRVEATLLKVFRQHASDNHVPAVPRAHRISLWTGRKVGAIAAAILILILTGAATLILRRPSPERADRLTSNETVVNIEPASAVSDTPSATKSVPSNRAHRRPAKHQRNQSELVTEYFSLIEGEDVNAAEFAQVVRVELPGSALRELGLPLSYESVTEPVKADVVLSRDGLARAIRFVR